QSADLPQPLRTEWGAPMPDVLLAILARRAASHRLSPAQCLPWRSTLSLEHGRLRPVMYNLTAPLHCSAVTRQLSASTVTATVPVPYDHPIPPRSAHLWHSSHCKHRRYRGQSALSLASDRFSLAPLLLRSFLPASWPTLTASS